jgi:hypothetical protein
MGGIQCSMETVTTLSDMPDDPHSEISGDTRKMTDQQFTRPTHASVGEDFMGLEDTLNDVLQ